MLKILSILMSAVTLVFGITIKKSELTAQYETVSSVSEVSEDMYIMDYKCDYFLDEMLEQGCSDIAEMVKFVSDRTIMTEDDFSEADYKGGGCSTFEAYTPDGDHIMGRNFDFKNAPCLVVWTHPQNHYASVAVADTNFMAHGTYINKLKNKKSGLALLAPYCCVDGVNEKGLAIAVLQVRADATNQNDETKKSLTTTAMIRAVLDTCANIDEAIALFSKYNMHDLLGCCYHYQLIDKTGKSVIIEYISDKMYVYGENSKNYSIKGSVFEDDDISWIYATNFTLTKEIGDFNAEQHGEDRAAAMIKVLKEKNGVMTECEAMDLLSYVKLDYKHPKYPWNIVALWSAVYNVNKGTMKIVADADFSKVYTFDIANPLKILKTEDVSKSAYTKTEWEYL